MSKEKAPLFQITPDTMQDPYAMFARVRAEDPIHQAGPMYFILTRYADVLAALRDPRFGRAPLEAGVAKAQGLENKPMYFLPMMFADPPEHTRLRGLATRAFTPRIVEALLPKIEQVTSDLLDRVEGQPSFDLISALAYKVPITSVCYLLGMPVVDHERIHELSEAHAAALSAGGLNERSRPVIERADRLRQEWAGYFRDLADRRREKPENDYISEIVRTHDTTEKLTEYELLATLMGLLFAGHTTTADAIGTGMYALLSHRDQWELLVKEEKHLDGAVEEVLRWEPPIQSFNRVALEDADVAGVPIPKGAMIAPLSGAANRDPAQFPDPERFDITRTPNKHLSFGGGVHFCLGSGLARAQIKMVFKALRERFPNLALGETKPTYRPSFGFRGLTRLDVVTG